MKRYTLLYIMVIGMLMLTGMTSCEKDLEMYSDATCRLNFYYDITDMSDFKPEMARGTYSFVYGDADTDNDTVWYEIETMGFTSGKDRCISIEQIQEEGMTNAVPGKHYVPFNDPSLADKYLIPAGKARTRVPIVMLRDASLKEEMVALRFRIKANEFFEIGYEPYAERVLYFTDMLAEPSKWTYGYPYRGSYTISLADYFGTYGVVKHRFLIEETGEKWDDEYIDKLMTGDSEYLMYMTQKMTRRLEAVNAERATQGLPPLAEADGTPVVIMEDSYGG